MTTTDTAASGSVFTPTHGPDRKPFMLDDSTTQLSDMHDIFDLVGDHDEEAELGPDGRTLKIRVTRGSVEDAIATYGDDLARLIGDEFKFTGTVYRDETDDVIGEAEGDPTYGTAASNR